MKRAHYIIHSICGQNWKMVSGEWPQKGHIEWLRHPFDDSERSHIQLSVEEKENLLSSVIDTMKCGDKKKITSVIYMYKKWSLMIYTWHTTKLENEHEICRWWKVPMNFASNWFSFWMNKFTQNNFIFFPSQHHEFIWQQQRERKRHTTGVSDCMMEYASCFSRLITVKMR